jgi:hypothetical protein
LGNQCQPDLGFDLLQPIIFISLVQRLTWMVNLLILDSQFNIGGELGIIMCLPNSFLLKFGSLSYLVRQNSSETDIKFQCGSMPIFLRLSTT